MAVKNTAVVAVGTTPTLIYESLGGSSQAPTGVLVYNDGANDIFLGGPSVTTAIGVPVAAGAFSPGLSLLAGEQLYGIVAAATENARTLILGD